MSELTSSLPPQVQAHHLPQHLLEPGQGLPTHQQHHHQLGNQRHLPATLSLQVATLCSTSHEEQVGVWVDVNTLLILFFVLFFLLIFLAFHSFPNHHCSPDGRALLFWRDWEGRRMMRNRTPSRRHSWRPHHTSSASLSWSHYSTQSLSSSLSKMVSVCVCVCVHRFQVMYVCEFL